MQVDIFYGNKQRQKERRESYRRKEDPPIIGLWVDMRAFKVVAVHLEPYSIELRASVTLLWLFTYDFFRTIPSSSDLSWILDKYINEPKLVVMIQSPPITFSIWSLSVSFYFLFSFYYTYSKLLLSFIFIFLVP